MQPLSLTTSFPGHRLETATRILSRRASRLILRNQHLLLRALQTSGGYAFGDCLTQQLGPLWPTSEWPSKHNLAKHDLSKTAAMAAVGACAGLPTSLALYAWMDSVAPGTGVALAAAKFALDQVIGCVLWQAAYMAVSEPYRNTFRDFAGAQWQQQQQQRQQQQRCRAGAAVAAQAASSTGGPAIAAC